MEIALEDLSDQLVDGAHASLGVLDTEGSEECSRAFIVYLQLYAFLFDARIASVGPFTSSRSTE